MSYRLSQEQIDELRAAVADGDTGKIESLLDAIYFHRRRLEREALEQVKRQQRAASPWIPDCR